MIAADATKFIGTLYTKTREKKYIYKESRIDALCHLFEIHAVSPSSKISALIVLAKKDPKKFLAYATAFENTTITEITHGLELNVIKFEGNISMYVTKDKVIKNHGELKMKLPEKIEDLAAYFRTSEGNEAYTEFRLELEYAKEQKLKNQ
jgi:hypothetical protein